MCTHTRDIPTSYISLHTAGTLHFRDTSPDSQLEKRASLSRCIYTRVNIYLRINDSHDRQAVNRRKQPRQRKSISPEKEAIAAAKKDWSEKTIRPLLREREREKGKRRESVKKMGKVQIESERSVGKRRFLTLRALRRWLF